MAKGTILGQEGFLPINGGLMNGNIDMNNKRIVGLADGINDNDAVNISQLHMKQNSPTLLAKGKLNEKIIIQTFLENTNPKALNIKITNINMPSNMNNIIGLVFNGYCYIGNIFLKTEQEHFTNNMNISYPIIHIERLYDATQKTFSCYLLCYKLSSYNDIKQESKLDIDKISLVNYSENFFIVNSIRYGSTPQIYKDMTGDVEIYLQY